MGRSRSSSGPLVAAAIAEWLAKVPSVWAVVLGGSHATGLADVGADIDLYVYSDEEPSVAVRQDLARALGHSAWVGCTAFGPGDEWPALEEQPAVDLMYCTPAWIEDQLARVLDRHQASVGYSTCLWHTVRASVPLFDRDGWFGQLQARATCGYPDGLRAAIVARNFPLLRDSPFSSPHQIEAAVRRDHTVSVQHRSAAFLASYVDVLFALNRLPHPGEKRLVRYVQAHCPAVPADFEASVARFLGASMSVPTDTGVTSAAPSLVDRLEDLLTAEDKDVLRLSGCSGREP